MTSEKGVTVFKTILFSQALTNFCNKVMVQDQPIPYTNMIFDQLEKKIYCLQRQHFWILGSKNGFSRLHKICCQ
jgi:hypothetical protein